MIVQFLVALIATVSFAVIYDAPRRELLFSGLSGAVGWVVFLVLTEDMQVNKVFACVVATFILTLIARILAVIRRCPVTVYLLVSIFPLVPGTGVYYTSYYLITRQNQLFASMGLETFETAAAIAFGIALGFGLPQSWFRVLDGKQRLFQVDFLERIIDSRKAHKHTYAEDNKNYGSDGEDYNREDYGRDDYKRNGVNEEHGQEGKF